MIEVIISVVPTIIIIVALGFALTWQHIHFLKKDIQRLEERVKKDVDWNVKWIKKDIERIEKK